MYSFPYYKENNNVMVQAFLRKYPFAVLMGCDASGNPVATQVPLLIKEKEGQLFFYGHVMRNTDHHKAFKQNPNVLALFTGPHTYVSASWYSNPQQGSTWNYMTVQAKGLLRFLDEAALISILQETTTQFENNENSPASFHQLPDEYVQKLVKAIDGFEIAVTQMENTFKLSQNRDEKSYHNIIQQLQKGDEAAQQIAAEMQARASQLFNSSAQ